MQQIVSSQILRSTRGARSILVLAVVGLVLPAVAFAGTPTLANLNVTVTSPVSADVSADVTSNGGSPPIGDRGFLYSVAADYPTPDLSGNVLVTRIQVPGTLGHMARSRSGLIPGTTYAIRAYAINSDPVDPGGLTPVQNFTTPCPVITLGPLPDSSVGANYFVSTAATGGSGAYSYTATGTLPPGLTLDPTFGFLSGFPTTEGVFSFTVVVSDANTNLCTGFRNYTLSVDALDVSPRKISFPSQVVGVPSPAVIVTITNNGAVAVALSPFVFTGPFSASSTDCGPSLPPVPGPNSCGVHVVYTPPGAAAHTGDLSIGHDQPQSPIKVSLRGAGVASASPQIYAANVSGSSVSVIDPVTNVVRAAIPVGPTPRILAALPGGGKIYVPTEGDYAVSVISTATDSVINIITGVFTGPVAAAATPDGKEIWVHNAFNASLSIIDTTSDTLVASISDSCIAYGEGGVAANPTNQEMYLFSNSGQVCVFDRISRTFLRSIPVGGSPNAGVVLPDGSALYVNGGASGVARVALPSGSVSYIAAVEGGSMDVKADGSKIYVTGPGVGGFGVINTVTNTFTPIPLSGALAPYGVAVFDSGGKVYVTDESANVVHVVSLATDTEILNPELPIVDGSFVAPASIVALRPAPTVLGAIPTVASLAATAAAFSASVSADVTADGGQPVFERGFAYVDTASALDPLPGAPGVSTLIVPGTTGPMSATLTGLGSGVSYSYRAYATNLKGTGVTTAGTFTTLTVTCTGVTIAPASIPNGIAGTAYPATTLVASGDGPAPYSYAITGGALPPGLTLSGDTISGTPTAAGTFSVDITATVTSSGCSGGTSFDLYVATPVAPGDLVISEFRTRGISGPLDEYVEIGNRTSGDIVVASQDGSGGWSIGQPGGRVALIPDGTLIEKGGHWLATGSAFSLNSYGLPDCVCGGDASLLADLLDDGGLALFTTADPMQYPFSTPLDAVGGAIETNPLFFEGTPLVEVVQQPDGPADPTAQTAWVRRMTSTGALSDTNDNSRDFIFVATDAGITYGPLGTVKAVLGAPNPEDSYTVHDVLPADLPVSLLDPSKGQDRYPNRWVECCAYAVEYRRVFKNNTGREITALSLKVIDLTTVNSRKTVAASRQAELSVTTAAPLTLEVPLGSNNFVNLFGSNLDYPSMYTFSCCESLGGLNSRVVVPFGLAIQPAFARNGTGPSTGVAPNDTVAVNIRARVWNSGYYFFVVMPQISFQPPRLLSFMAGKQTTGRRR